MSARFMILTGLALLILGVAVPFMMVIQLVESTFFLNFASFTIQLIGLVMGVVGLTRSGIARRKKEEDEAEY
jgi:hypothetical protein